MSNLSKKNRGVNPTPGRSIFSDFITDVDRFLDNDLFLMPMHLKRQLEGKMPAVNIRDREHEYLIELAAPGMNKEDFNIVMDEGMLTISSQREDERTEEKENYSRREYNFSSFSRSLNLPDNVDAENIKAQYQDGILSVAVPKIREEQRPKRRIPID